MQLHDNFFGNPGAQDPVTGTIDSVEFQYVLSLGGLMRYPAAFWGDGPDLIASVFGMFNKVSAPMNSTFDGIKKLKFGGDLTYLPLPWFGIGGRFDKVSPNMDDGDSTFSVFSPRLIFKTAFVTHEQIILQYSRYFYGATRRTRSTPTTTSPARRIWAPTRTRCRSRRRSGSSRQPLFPDEATMTSQSKWKLLVFSSTLFAGAAAGCIAPGPQTPSAAPGSAASIGKSPSAGAPATAAGGASKDCGPEGMIDDGEDGNNQNIRPATAAATGTRSSTRPAPPSRRWPASWAAHSP